MWWVSFATALLVLLGGSALAATGDALIVTGDGVNVRSGPSRDAAVITRVYRNQQVIELEREGDWVRAEISGTIGREGWIHSSLLSPPAEEAPPEQVPAATESEPPAPPPTAAVTPETHPAKGAPAPAEAEVPLPIEPATGRDGDPAELARFRETVSYLNGRAMAVAGLDLFTGVKPATGGVVQVMTTEAWSSLPPAGRQSYLNTLLDRWAATHARAEPVAVQIVDPNGEVVMEKTEP